MRLPWKICKRWLAWIQEYYADTTVGYLWEWLALQFSLSWRRTAKAHGKGVGDLLWCTSSRALAALEKWLQFVIACIIFLWADSSIWAPCTTEAQVLLNSLALQNDWEVLLIFSHLSTDLHAGAAPVSDSSLGSRVLQPTVYTPGASSYITRLLSVCAIV